MKENDLRECPVCKMHVLRENMQFTRDCHGIVMRLVCKKCYDKIMFNAPGYDGAYYTDADEFIGDTCMSEAEYDAWGY